MPSFSFKGKIWPIVGFVAVMGLWLVSAAANYYAGVGLSSDPVTSQILGAASISADLMKAVAIFIIVAAAANQRWVVCGVGVLVFALCATWSMRSATHFASTMMTEKAAERSQAHDIQKSSLDLLGIKTRRAAFLAEQTVTVNVNNKYARTDAISENRRSSVEFDDLVKDIESQQKKLASVEVAVAGDPIAALFGLSDRTVILASALFFAALLEVVSGVGFWIIAQSRVPRVLQASPILKDVTPSLSPTVLQDAPGPRGGKPMPVLASPTIQDDKPTKASNVVQFAPKDVAMQAIAANLFEADATSRIPLQTVVEMINAELPSNKRISQTHKISTFIMPSILDQTDLFPNVEKRKIGGRTFVLGIRVRSIESRAQAA